jgi:uncharacterized repeat protein (TIGR02543 family)
LDSAYLYYDHLVSFDSRGGSDVEPAGVADGDPVAEPTAPTRAGYVFAGWYVDPNGSGDAYDFSAQVTGDMTLYARWRVDTEGSASGKNTTAVASGSSDAASLADTGVTVAAVALGTLLLVAAGAGVALWRRSR